MRLHITILLVLASTPIACGTEIVLEDGDPNDGTGALGQGGQGSADVDPVAECDRLNALLDGLPACKESWNTEACVTDLEFAREFGCLAETLAVLRCYASTCEDAEVCRPEGDAYVQCHDDRRAESG